ncbi:FMN-binding glutamate synthase family protein [Streptomyces sp. NPDC005859]|uniref:FMN-binding glutamate synthase family protein n=1 Tax=Streptomyces sp. NPDC005859 TaxID=3157170 RepID=UPI0034098005
MRRFLPLLLVGVLAATASVAARTLSTWWWLAAGPLLAAVCLGAWDLLQRRRSVLRGYPLVGRLLFPTEKVRVRSAGTGAREPFGGGGSDGGVHEYLVPSLRPVAPAEEPPLVRVGGPHCTQPYDMALLNVSAMSFGALSSRAVLALNRGAALGRFAHDTGEGGLSEHHLRGGGDLVWEIGTGYFGCRGADGGFDAREFADKAALPEVKCVSVKLSQGAFAGSGAVLPGVKVSAEIASERKVPVGETVVSPPFHQVFSTPRELVLFLARLRELAGGKPTGFKLCVGSRREFLAVCRAMAAEGLTPDFVVVDGAEGGTGAGPAGFAGHLGMPLTQGLITVHNALVGVGLRDRIRIGASGRVATGPDIVKRLVQGADYTNAARAMMRAVGCVGARRCHTGACPAGVATQDPLRARALDVADKARQVRRYQRETVRDAVRIMAAMGVRAAAELTPGHLVRRTGPGTTSSYAELYEWLAPGELLAGPPRSWESDWKAADPDSFDQPAEGPRATGPARATKA